MHYTSDSVMTWRKLLHRPNSVKPGITPAGRSAQPVLFECKMRHSNTTNFDLTNRGGWKTVRNPKLRQSRTKPAEATVDVYEQARTEAQQHRAKSHCKATTKRTEPRALDQKHHTEAAKTVKRPMNWSTKEPVSTKAMFMKAKNHAQARPTAAVKVTKSRMIA